MDKESKKPQKLATKIFLKNIGPLRTGFKIKSNKPAKYGVMPNLGIINPDE